VIPVNGGRRGNPVLFDRSVFQELEGISGDVGAKTVVKENAAKVLEVEVDDEGVLRDIDTPSDLKRTGRLR